MGTLAVVEDPGPDSQSSEDQDSDVVPITSSMRTTIKHLYASAGPWFWLRGAFYYIIYRAMFFLGVTSYLPDLEGRSNFVQLPFHFFLGALCANWQATWVHSVISKPSTQSFLERLIRFRYTSAALAAIAMHARLASPAFEYGARFQSGLINRFHFEPNPQSQYQTWALSLFPCAVECVISLLTRIMFIRLAASSLPQDEQPIIRLDPSLGSEDDESAVTGWNIGHLWGTLTGPGMRRAWVILGRQFVISMVITVLGMTIDPSFPKDIAFPLVWFH